MRGRPLVGFNGWPQDDFCVRAKLAFARHDASLVGNMNQHVHNVWLYSRKTSIHVEPEFWEQFPGYDGAWDDDRELAEIDRTQRLFPYQGPGRPRVLAMSAAVRVFVLQTSWQNLLMLKHVPAAVVLCGVRRMVDTRALHHASLRR